LRYLLSFLLHHTATPELYPLSLHDALPICAKALQGSAGKMMRELGREPSALGAATEYRQFADGFVIDREDLALVEGVRSLGMRVLAAHTVMRTPEDRVALARSVLEFASSIREARALEVE